MAAKDVKKKKTTHIRMQFHSMIEQEKLSCKDEMYHSE